MTALVELEYPLRTVSALNEREHWASKARRVKRERAATMGALDRDMGWRRQQEARGLLAKGRHLVVELTRVSRGTLDTGDNLPAAFKGVRDEVATWLGLDDRDPRVCWAYAQAKGKAFAVRLRIAEEAR